MFQQYDGLFIIILLIVGLIIVPIIQFEKMEQTIRDAVKKEMDEYWGDEDEI